MDPNVLCNSSAVAEVGDAYNIQVVQHKQDEVARSKVVVAHNRDLLLHNLLGLWQLPK